MPRVDAGSYIVPIEALMRVQPERLDWVWDCQCLIEYEPVVATVEVEGLRIEVAIGVGSLLCTGCEPPLSYYRLLSPVWARATRLNRRCMAAGDDELLEKLSKAVSLELEVKSPDEVLKTGGIIALPKGIYFDVLDGFCARVRPTTPLHPLTAPLAEEPEACIEELVEPVAGVWRSGLELLKARGKSLAYKYTVVSSVHTEALLLAAKPSSEKGLLWLGYMLGSLYACSIPERS